MRKSYRIRYSQEVSEGFFSIAWSEILAFEKKIALTTTTTQCDVTNQCPWQLKAMWLTTKTDVTDNDIDNEKWCH